LHQPIFTGDQRPQEPKEFSLECLTCASKPTNIMPY
jgi:hypothetical protein